MRTKFKVGDHVRWNSEAGHVRGKIIKVHTKDTHYKGYTHHASKDDPQYEIKSIVELIVFTGLQHRGSPAVSFSIDLAQRRAASIRRTPPYIPTLRRLASCKDD